MANPIEAIMIGAGQRGKDCYGPYALQRPDEIRFVAVAEPDQQRRDQFSQQHAIPADRQFESWEQLLEQGRLGGAALICTQDQMHTEPAIHALRLGYDVLLEKPIAPTLAECRRIVAAAADYGRQLHICHVLRYSPHFQKVKEVIDSGVLGEVINISHRENVSWWHMAHSFVRGSWRNSRLSAPMILAKCCHDLDLLVWLLGARCESLNSFGSLQHYRPENAPPGSTSRCLDGCAVADTCRYYAPLIYVDHTPMWNDVADTSKGFEKLATRAKLKAPWTISILAALIPSYRWFSDYRGWPSSIITQDATPENVLEALRHGPYGRCVYHCDNDVVDNQIVGMQFENGVTASLTMHGHSHQEGRTTIIEGTNASLQSEFWYGSSWVEVNEHRSNRRTRYNTFSQAAKGHGGGDFHLMEGFVRALRDGDESAALTTAAQSLESHLMAFAAEEARLSAEVVQLQTFRRL